ncbi:S1 family peptidase [Saccharothrix variisporea]|uniref:Streptogrisin D n=1 Tax=Saccharothrix variisporea TaxID=543527 RepID=A0A495X506_9PSEU|nr:S1 family peptidase [Saccharothrix variisporea]RKT69080.1 streptogrisin D [Saccharothrix variisporea]
MRSRVPRRLGTVVVATGLVLASLLTGPAAQAEPVSDPDRAAALAADAAADAAAQVVAELGDTRTAGVYQDDDGRVVVGVTDEAAAQAVRDAGGTPQLVANSTAALTAIHAEFDQLAGIANTSWGVDPSTNKVSVEIHEGVSAADEARLVTVAARHGGAVSVEHLPGKIEFTAYDMRGGVGITSGSRLCTAGFNVQNSSGKKYMITAGHCMIGGYYEWNRYSGNIPLGRMSSFNNEPGDWAVVEYRASNVSPLGMIQYRDGSAHQITGSRWVRDGEGVKRTGTSSQDFVGKVLDPSVTVNYDGGVTLYKMIKTSLCSIKGDSGGPLFSGETALGIASGSDHPTSTCNDGVSTHRSYYQPLQAVLIDKGLRVY